MSNATKMKISSIFLLFSFLFILPNRVFADFVPTAYYQQDGEMMQTTDVLNDAQAPLHVTFKANPSSADDVAEAFEWRFTKEGEASPFMVRYEQDTDYEFRESGTTTIALYVSYDKNQAPILISTIKITISASLLEVPNAFSPNGDGINDVYKVKSNHKSIVEFHGYIFNRWGVKVYEWTDIDGGWDGTYKGTKVKNGVYFALIKAKGADGIEYNIKRDANILTDYIENAE